MIWLGLGTAVSSCAYRVLILRDEPGNVKGESYPIQDEPEGEVGFQYKMSLKGMAC
jgi:hypothetical protein